MRRSNWTPSIVPTDDQTVYLVLDDFGSIGRAWRETDVATAADLETIINLLLAGEYNDPVRIAGFNTAEGWSVDASELVAEEVRRRCNFKAMDLPSNLEGFMQRHEHRADRSQLKLV